VQDFFQTVEPNSSVPINVDAEGVACVECNLPAFSISVDDNQPVQFRQGYELVPAGGFKRLTIINENAVPLVVRLMTWRGRFVDRRFMSNQPQGIDPVTLEDLADKAFFFNTSTLGGATAYAHIGLRNPTGSGRVMVLKKIVVTVGQDNTPVSLDFHQDQTDYQSPAGSPKRKFPPYAPGVGVATVEARATRDLSPTASFGIPRIKATEPYTWMPTEPFVLRPGWRVAWIAGQVDTFLSVHVDMLEIDGA
jgi:hypothetical protein